MDFLLYKSQKARFFPLKRTMDNFDMKENNYKGIP